MTNILSSATPIDKSWTKLGRAIESKNAQTAARLLVEILLDQGEDEAETELIQDVAADFIENEVGRFDWLRNWGVIRSQGDPVPKVQAYLDTYAITADARKIVAEIDRMAVENPGRWK